MGEQNIYFVYHYDIYRRGLINMHCLGATVVQKVQLLIQVTIYSFWRACTDGI